MGELGDARGLPHTVDADDENYFGLPSLARTSGRKALRPYQGVRSRFTGRRKSGPYAHAASAPAASRGGARPCALLVGCRVFEQREHFLLDRGAQLFRIRELLLFDLGLQTRKYFGGRPDAQVGGNQRGLQGVEHGLVNLSLAFGDRLQPLDQLGFGRSHRLLEAVEKPGLLFARAKHL